MTSPYTAALKIKEREVDKIKLAIGEEVHRLSSIEHRTLSLQERIRAERSLVAGDAAATSTAYFDEVRRELNALMAERRRVSVRVDELREKAREALGSFRAIEKAADIHHQELGRIVASAEQTALDDTMSTKIALATRAARAFARRGR